MKVLFGPSSLCCCEIPQSSSCLVEGKVCHWTDHFVNSTLTMIYTSKRALLGEWRRRPRSQRSPWYPLAHVAPIPFSKPASGRPWWEILQTKITPSTCIYLSVVQEIFSIKGAPRALAPEITWKIHHLRHFLCSQFFPYARSICGIWKIVSFLTMESWIIPRIWKKYESATALVLVVLSSLFFSRIEG